MYKKQRSAIKTLSFIVLLFTSLFLFGCIKKIEPPDSYLKKNQIEFIQKDHLYYNNCTVMICNYSGLGGKIKGFFSRDSASLVGKECSFKYYDVSKKEDLDKLNSLTGLNRENLENTSSQTLNLIQPAMIGIGDSVFAGDELFSNCNGHLGINLIDISNLPKDIESDVIEERFLEMNDCILEYGSIPFYKFGRLEAPLSLLSSKLKGEGPIFISPGYGYNKSKFDPEIISPVASFSIIKSNCKNCLVTATINYGDIDTLEYYKQYKQDWESIDVIAFIADINTFDSCNQLQIIQGENNSLKSFAQSVIEKYEKPVIIIVQGKEGKNAKGNCDWNNYSIAKFYDYLIRSIPDLVSSGVIAIVVQDISQLQNDSLKSYSFFCSLYYTPKTPSFNFLVYNVFSTKGDKPSGCNMYRSANTMFMFGEVKDYKSLPVEPIKKENSCNSKLFLNYDVGIGGFNTEYCKKNKIAVSNFASKYFLDSSLYMAVLNKLNYYETGKISEYEKHCTSKCEKHPEKELCCLAETMAYYQNKTISKKSNINDLYLAYFIAYGTLKGESAYNQEFNKHFSSSTEFKDEATNSRKLESVTLQTSQCRIYEQLCKEYNSIYYCYLYDQQCRFQTPTIPEVPSTPTKPEFPDTTPPSEQTPTTPSPPPSSLPQLDTSILFVLKDAASIKKVCELE